MPGKERLPNASLTLIADKKREWKQIALRAPMGDASERLEDGIRHARVRVRTPGKHIVLFSLAVTFMIAISTLVLSRADLALRNHPFSAIESAPVQETFVADLAPDALGRLRLIRLTVEITAPAAEARRLVDERRAEVRERIAFFLRELSPEDLDGPEAQARLKSELLRRINLTLAPEAADAVIIRSLVIQ